ncbi:MAG TPA: type II secretion system F family protein [Candidatus Paceibacterota bacterium]|nr:type II secretion system F family protein [Verrucomicrobiota bacterium]HRY47921.1 type II secretion system F family protein [Candidatus Paceibacterota bacterium]HSA00338.1 type II secretion system F family protein [Candidatus Paceibacterota bacterium]
MALFVTPRHLNLQGELYHQLGAMTAAGMGLGRVLETLQRSPPARFQRPMLRMLAARLEQGCTYTEALQGVRQGIPEFDIALLSAGEQSGRLDAGFHLLAEHYQERSAMLRELLGNLLYPLFLFHAAVFIFPFPQFFLTGNWGGYLVRVGGILALAYIPVLLLILACQGRRGESWRLLLESIGRGIPLVGSTRRAWALARLSAALDALISAGISIVEGWQKAAAASGSPLFKRVVDSWQSQLESGATPGELVRNSPQFPELFANQYQTAEISGRMEETLQRMHRFYRDEAARTSRALAQWIPRLVYFGIILVIAYRIVTFYLGYFGQINDLLQ